LAGVGGLELHGDRGSKLNRLFVAPEYRDTGIADTVIGALFDYVGAHELEIARIETGDTQGTAIAFYRRHGFRENPALRPDLASQTLACLKGSDDWTVDQNLRSE
jgi:ribosomal protein S18 acetylase RimI-like enzyme